jgi:hypothetical protein
MSSPTFAAMGYIRAAAALFVSTSERIPVTRYIDPRAAVLPPIALPALQHAVLSACAQTKLAPSLIEAVVDM